MHSQIFVFLLLKIFLSCPTGAINILYKSKKGWWLNAKLFCESVKLDTTIFILFYWYIANVLIIILKFLQLIKKFLLVNGSKITQNIAVLKRMSQKVWSSDVPNRRIPISYKNSFAQCVILFYKLSWKWWYRHDKF